MEHIVDTILKIESEAKKRIANAEIMSNDIISQTKQSGFELRNLIKAETEEKIAKIQNNEDKIITENVEKINNECSGKIAILDRIYDDNHNQWEEEIYCRIVGE